MAIDQIQHMEKDEVQITYRRQVDYDKIITDKKIEIEGIGEIEIFPVNEQRKIVSLVFSLMD